METSEKSMDRRAPMDMDVEVAAALADGADLEKIVEKAIGAQVFGLLREAGADERRRYKALAELQKFAKLLEQKRNREERTKVQQQRLALLQAGQQAKLRDMETKSQVPAQVPAKIAPAKIAPAKIAPAKIAPAKMEATRTIEPSVPATPAAPAMSQAKAPQEKVAQVAVTPESMTPKPMTEDERRRQERHLALMEERQRMKRERTEMKQRQWELQWQRKEERRRAAQAASGAVEHSQVEEPARERAQEHRSSQAAPTQWPLPPASTFEPSVNIHPAV